MSQKISSIIRSMLVSSFGAAIIGQALFDGIGFIIGAVIGVGLGLYSSFATPK